MLNIIKEIKKDGLDFVVKKYGLLYKPCGNHKFLLKYGLESRDFKSVMAVRECRGLVLTNDTYEIMSLPFVRFFNIEEPNADPIDLKNATIMKKEDGSVMTMYWDWILDCWCVQTSGTADAETTVNGGDMTFSKLFWNTWEQYNSDLELYDKRKNYVFELCTAYNQVVAFHKTAKLVLLNVRNLDDMTELSYDELTQVSKIINIPVVEAFKLNSIEEIREALSTMNDDEEGFVAYDGLNRVKIKNIKYVIKHSSVTNITPKDLFNIIKSEDRDEFLGILESYKELYNNLERFYLHLLIAGYRLRDKAKDFLKDNPTKKEFVEFVTPQINDKNRMFKSAVFYLHEYEPSAYLDSDLKLKETNFKPEDVLSEISNEILYKLYQKLEK